MLETSALLVFVRIVDGRSLAAAARALGMPRATVSRKLALLEEELGVRLLRRTTRSLSLTDAGRDLLRHARIVVDAALAAARSVARREDDVRGDVRLSIGPHVANALADVIASFVAAHPSVRLFVQVTHRTVDLRRDPIDVAIRASKALSAGLVARRLARASLVAVASPRYLAEHGEPRTLRDLAVHRCLMGLDDALSPRTSFPSSTGRAVAARGVFFSDDPPLLLEGASVGSGSRSCRAASSTSTSPGASSWSFSRASCASTARSRSSTRSANGWRRSSARSWIGSSRAPPPPSREGAPVPARNRAGARDAAYDGGVRRPPADRLVRPEARFGRRAFSLGVASAIVAGCGGDDAVTAAPNDAGPLDAGPLPPSDPDLVALHAFVGEGARILDKRGFGLDARTQIDLSSLAPDTLDVDASRFFVRTERPDLLPPGAPEAIVIGGLVEAEARVPTAALLASARPQGVHLLECSGNGKESAFGLISSTRWRGTPIAELLGQVTPTSADARVLVHGVDDHSRPSASSVAGAAWIFSRAELLARGAFLATHMSDRPLLPDHGAPARLFVPGYYGCTCIKWVDRIELVPDDAPATSHMKEFAGRTHQHYAFDLAREYAPPLVQAAAICTRAEHRRIDGRVRLRLRGLVWGGASPATLVRLFVGSGGGDPVSVSTPAGSASTWGMWEYVAPPLAAGRYDVRLRVEPIETPQRRLDSGFYTRTFEVRG